jgi:xylulokinase
MRAWDDAAVEVVSGTNAPEEIARVKRMLGEVDTSGGGRRVGNISPYFVERYRFNAGT